MALSITTEVAKSPEGSSHAEEEEYDLFIA